MAHGTQETEIKLAVDDAKTARRMLRAAGFHVSKRRLFEVNNVFDTSDLTLRKAGLLLRLRQAGSVQTLTYKGPSTLSKHKSREELELVIPDARVMTAIFERLGYNPVFRYEKYRTEFKQHRGWGVAVLDETPVGIYLELEGTSAWIDRTARKLNFSERDYLTQSYAGLYLDWCRLHGIEPGDMVFGGRAAQAQANTSRK
jgi:adenylate cyclase class 2